ncbi:MAG TPA: RHS repeat-associated core domain-containing protein, partial [Candidatus Acidoferrales bacterium]|nr:RHS repeat-associated core domain-containing protein [Candidatus Acidoferrales bacterium]
DDFGARYYSSRLGRWLSADWSSVPAPVPYANLANPQTLNLYAMVSDNPETFADLDGHYETNPDLTTTKPRYSGRISIDVGGNDSSTDQDKQQQAQTAQPQAAQAPQGNDTQQLTQAQDAARNNPANQPRDGNTYCNNATYQTAAAMGAPLAPLSNNNPQARGTPAAMANEMAGNLAKSDQYKAVAPAQAQQFANKGQIVIAVQPNPHGHGHVATVRPDASNHGSNPTINNVGRHVGVAPASRAFNSHLPAPKYYTPN